MDKQKMIEQIKMRLVKNPNIEPKEAEYLRELLRKLEQEVKSNATSD